MTGKLPTQPQGAVFATTRWSVVLTAQDPASPDAAAALEILCRTYWYPLYAYVRGSGHSPEDAQDLTQEFFARLLANDWLRVVQREKGPFRAFLRFAMKRFLSHEWHRATAAKRGGGQSPVPLDAVAAEHRFAAEPALGPDDLYERRWAMTLLDTALERLEAEFTVAGRAAEFECLKEWLTADRGTIPYSTIAGRLGTTEGAARVAVHRLRKRYREVFRETVAATVDAEVEVESEMRHLVAVLARG